MGDPWRIFFFGGGGPRTSRLYKKKKKKKKKKIGGKSQKSEKLENNFLTVNDLKSIGNSKKSLLKA